jgi:hypothetical protein
LAIAFFHHVGAEMTQIAVEVFQLFPSHSVVWEMSGALCHGAIVAYSLFVRHTSAAGTATGQPRSSVATSTAALSRCSSGRGAMGFMGLRTFASVSQCKPGAARDAKLRDC